MTPKVRGYLKTLRRIPDNIVLSLATRNFEMTNPASCLTGWALREAVGALRGQPAEDVPGNQYLWESCSEQFGGTDDEWRRIFDGVCCAGDSEKKNSAGYCMGCGGGDTHGHLPLIEEAFARRVAECV